MRQTLYLKQKWSADLQPDAPAKYSKNFARQREHTLDPEFAVSGAWGYN